jgi:hypothetical protein
MKAMVSSGLLALSTILFVSAQSDRAFASTRHIIIQTDKTYTVYSKDGEVLFENITLEAL